MATVNYCNGATYTENYKNRFWDGWAFTPSEALLLNKLGFRKTAADPANVMRVAVVRLNASNQIISVVAQNQWYAGDIPSGPQQDVWYTLPSAAALETGVKYAVLMAMFSGDTVCAITDGAAGGTNIIIGATTAATVAGFISTSPTGNTTYPLVANNQTCIIDSGTPGATTAGNKGMIIDVTAIASISIESQQSAEATLTVTPDTQSTPPIDVTAEFSADAPMVASAETVEIKHVEPTALFTAESTLSVAPTSLEIKHIEPTANFSAESSMTVSVSAEPASDYYQATAPIDDNTPDSVVAIAGVLRDGVWYWSVESDALAIRWLTIGAVTISKINETIRADCPITLTLNAVVGAEYRGGSGVWQEAPTPVLVSGTTYRITLNYSIAVDDVAVRFRVTDAGSNTYSSISTLVVVIPATTYRIGEPPLPPHWVGSISSAVRTLIGEPLKQYMFSIATAVLTRVGVDCRSLVEKVETGNIHRSPVDASASIRWDNRLDEPFITQAVTLVSTDTGAQATTTATKDTTTTGAVGLTKQTGDGTSTGAKALTQSGAVKLTKLNTPTAPVKHVSVKKEAAALDETGTKRLNPQFKPD